MISGQNGTQVELNSDNPTNVRLYCEGDSYYLMYTSYDPAQWSDVCCVSRINLDGKLMWKDDVKILGEAVQLWPISDGFILTYIVDNVTYAQCYASDGSKMWPSEICLAPDYSVYKNYYGDTFIGSVDGNDGIIVAYNSYDQSGNSDILMQHINKDGSFTNFCSLVVNDDYVTSFISSNVDGEIFYAYESSEYDDHKVAVVRISTEGTYLWSNPKILDEAKSSATPLSVHKLEDGRLFILYTKGDSWSDGNLCAGVMSVEGDVEWKRLFAIQKETATMSFMVAMRHIFIGLSLMTIQFLLQEFIMMAVSIILERISVIYKLQMILIKCIISQECVLMITGVEL